MSGVVTVFQFPYRTVAEVSLSRLVRNLVTLRTFSGREVIPVIKADAYGHGLVPVARALVHRGCVELVAVATLEEALEVRKKIPDVGILVLSSFFPHQLDAYLKHRISVMVHCLHHLKSLSGRNRLPPIHLKIDTGMNRLGIRLDEVSEAIRTIDKFPDKIAGLATHFAESENVSSRFTEEQLERFEFVRALMARSLATDVRIHAANSGGVFHKRLGPSTSVRAGLSLFGLLPSDTLSTEKEFDITPVLEWKTRVLCVRDVAQGETVGYGRTYTARRNTRLALLPIGYADGYPRLLSQVGEVLVLGRRAPIVGVVSMDLTAIDVTAIDETAIDGSSRGGVKEGTEVTLIGKSGKEEISAWEVARHAQTIAYEIVCGISARVTRLYFE